MRRYHPLSLLALLLSALLLAGCNPNPTPEEACTLGPNGGNPVIIVAGTFSPAIANELFLGNSLELEGFTHCVFELKGSKKFGNLPGTMPIDVSAIALSLFADEVLEWAGETEVDLVGHSQGALVARSYIKNWGGNGKVGKTTLTKALEHGKVDPSHPVDGRTYGFDSFGAVIPHAGECTMVDFGGQPEYWIPHAIFLGNRSGVYLVVIGAVLTFVLTLADVEEGAL